MSDVVESLYTMVIPLVYATEDIWRPTRECGSRWAAEWLR